MLARVISEHGAPNHFRSDNSPEFIVEGQREFLKEPNVGALMHIEPGSPWQNGSAESFCARVKHELIGVEMFRTMKEAEAVGGDWRGACNHRRPYSALGY